VYSRLHSFHRLLFALGSALPEFSGTWTGGCPAAQAPGPAIPPPLCRRRLQAEAPAAQRLPRPGDHGHPARLHRRPHKERSSRRTVTITTADGSVVTTTTSDSAGAYRTQASRRGSYFAQASFAALRRFNPRPFLWQRARPSAVDMFDGCRSWLQQSLRYRRIALWQRRSREQCKLSVSSRTRTWTRFPTTDELSTE